MSKQFAEAHRAQDDYLRAADWHLRLRELERHGAELPVEEVEAGERFYSDPRNRDTLSLLARISQHLKSMPVPAVPHPGADDAYDGSVSVAEWRSRRQAARPGWRESLRRRPTILGGVAVAASLLIALLTHPSWLYRSQLSKQTFSTGTAQHKEVVLSDGSKIELGAQTGLTVRFSANLRWIRLDRGEALFTVAHDPRHPFIVDAGNGSVSAVGTQFDVRRDLDLVTVAVTDGAVVIGPRTEKLPGTMQTHSSRESVTSVRLEKGQELSYDDTQRRTGIRSTAAASTLWKQGRFQYRDLPLKYVVADLNRYRVNPIVIRDDAAGAYGFTGTIFLDHTSEWLLSLEKILPLEVLQGGHGEVSIGSSRADSAAPPTR